MRAVDIIAKKRDGQTLSAEELAFFVAGFTRGAIPDYQAAAWAMAVLWRGMTDEETTALTMAMVHSGAVLDLTAMAPVVVDKHSTGGVGDKTTLVVLPLVAAAGLPVVKMSGRGLGFTGGTLDKLEAIPGFNVSLSLAECLSTVRACGIALAGQTADLAPADGKLYALRDATATVPSLPLIASSIMSKKIAGGAQAIVLDVKVGRGAFMETLPEAEALAQRMIRIGEGVGRRVTAVLSDMSQPLGQAVGNALEVREAIATLQNTGPDDFLEHCLVFASEMLVLGRVADTTEEARDQLLAALRTGKALHKFQAWVQAQKGDPRVVDDPARLPQAPVIVEILAPQSGYIHGIDAREIGLTSMLLGAGRARKDAAVDHAVGLVLGPKVGAWVQTGDSLCTVHARRPADVEAVRDRLLAAYALWPEPIHPPPLIHAVLHSA